MNKIHYKNFRTKRKRGRVPLVAIFLAICLIGAFLAFFGPAWVEIIKNGA
jgi:uncharacterized membrane protein (DUF485 family)